MAPQCDLELGLAREKGDTPVSGADGLSQAPTTVKPGGGPPAQRRMEQGPSGIVLAKMIRPLMISRVRRERFSNKQTDCRGGVVVRRELFPRSEPFP